ncbi:MAG: YerC/YecD family TrpR-related protein [Acholeplasma sp.]|nr:YerC/YecD family TrpR-related protein [Acholeplasma sp.]
MEIKSQSKIELFEAILALKDIKQCEAFFDDLLTKKELDAMTQRLHAAKLLLAGKTYDQIIKDTQISSTTLSRISTCIRYGNGGYKSVLEQKDK